MVIVLNTDTGDSFATNFLLVCKMIEFNGMLISLELFYVFIVHSYSYFLCSCFLRVLCTLWYDFKYFLAQLAGAVEYTDCVSAVG